MIGDAEMNLHGRRLIDSKRSHGIEIAFDHAPPLDGDGLAKRLADPVERRALHLVLGVAGVDDLAAHIAGNPYLVHLHIARGGHRRLNHLGEVTEVTKMKRHALSSSPWK